MILVPPNATIVVMHEPINFRAGIDGIAAIARLVLESDPMSGALFVFRNRRGHMLRVLCFDGSGSGSARSGCRRAASKAGPPATGRVVARRCSPASSRFCSGAGILLASPFPICGARSRNRAPLGSDAAARSAPPFRAR